MHETPPSPPKKAYGLLPMVITLAIFVAGSFIHILDVGGMLTTLIAAGAGVLFLSHSLGAAYAEAWRGFMLACGFSTTAWLVWAGVDQAWRMPQLAWLVGVLAVGGFGSTGPWQSVRHTQYRWKLRRYRKAQLDQHDDEDPARPTTEKEQWDATFAEVGLGGLEFMQRVEHPAGFALRVTTRSVTENALLAKLETLETHIQYKGSSLPRDCVNVEPVLNDQGRALAGEYLLTFDVTDVLGEILMMPDEHHPLSVLEAFPIGRYSDGTTIYLSLTEVQTMIAGLTGSGKSMLLNVIIHQLSRCPDVVIWFGDMKEGTTAKLWLLAWLRRLMGSPVLDWVAADRWELERMLRAAAAIIGARTRMHTGNRWKVTRHTPAIVLILDEIADAVGVTRAPRSVREGRGITGAEMANLLALIVGKGRSEGVWVVAAGQRNSVSMFGSGDLMSQMGQRVAFAGIEAQMVSAMFQSEPLAARLVRTLIHEGTFVQLRKLGKAKMGQAMSLVKRARAYFLGDDDHLDDAIVRASMLHEEYLGVLDDATAAIADQFGYNTRWEEERLYWLMLDGKSPDDPSVFEVDDQTESTPTPASPLKEPEMKADPKYGFWTGARTAEPTVTDREGRFKPGHAAPSNRYDYTFDKQLLLKIIDGSPDGITFTGIMRQMGEGGAKAGMPAVNAWLKEHLLSQRVKQPAGPRTMWFPGDRSRVGS